MIFRNEHDRSYVPKLVIAVAIFGSICMCGYLMYFEESEIIPLLQAYKINGNYVRNILVISCFYIYFLRLLITLFVFFQRKMYWVEALVIANIMPWILPYIAYVAGRSSTPIGVLEVGGILLFLMLIPLKETYLKRKYGQEFYEYAATTKKLIPIIY